MEKLLHWSIANAQGDKDAIKKAGQPDPKLLEQLFGGGGPDDPTLMKEAMLVMRNREATLDNRLIAFDNFEMLIENLDNANNIENLKLWQPLIDLLADPEDEIRAFAASVIGTAVQNNDTSQNNFLRYEGSLETLINMAGNSKETSEVRIKALYALSNLVRNHKTVAENFDKANGWHTIAQILHEQISSTKLKMRSVSLVSAYLTAVPIEDSLLSILRSNKILDIIINYLSTEADLNLLDRCLSVLAQLVDSSIKFSEPDLVSLKQGFDNITQYKDTLNQDDYAKVHGIL